MLGGFFNLTGPFMRSHTGILGIEGDLFGLGFDSGSGFPMFFPPQCADVVWDEVGSSVPHPRQWSVLPPCVPRNLQLFSETSPVFLSFTMAVDVDSERGLRTRSRASSQLVPSGVLDRSRVPSPVVDVNRGAVAPTPFRWELPLLNFDGTGGPEVEEFCRSVWRYMFRAD